ncbi:MAG TPA: cell wall metabolism sensor histidine kinase WalK [Clostridiaceae bacterium]|nr:cell wall metabolism sensor histidine kinase WalK [Clostridiaceae bacterium]
MLRSIFSKMVFVFLSILIAGFTITGVMLYFFLGNYVSNEKAATLNQVGEVLIDYVNAYVENEENPLSRYLLSKVLESYSTNYSSIIFITNKDGYIVSSGPSLNRISGIIKSHLNEEDGVYSLPDLRQHNKVLAGQNTEREIGDFYGVFKETGYEWLTVKKPFKFKVSGYEADVTGVIYLHTPVPEIQKARATVFSFFIVSVGVAIVISIVLVYIFSLKLTKPLKKISNAAKLIASGEFSKRLDIDSKDEIGELAKSFNQMGVALQNLEDMRRGFIANVSHELRTPMTSIKGFVEGILDGTIPPDRRNDYLKIVKDEADRLNRLVNDLLTLAKMESGEVSLTLKDFDINELIRLCIIKLENLITNKNIMVNATFEEETLYVNADKDAIERVVYNLLHNAIKFTPDNGVISVDTRSYKDKVLVTVKDTGIGIEKEDIERIWERFYKSDKSRSRDKSGTGLGLAIVRNIINEHNQEIWVESEPGRGTKFTFTLNKAQKQYLNN